MKEFNKARALRKLKFKQNKGRYIKYSTLGISCLFLVIGVMYFTFAKFESQSPEWTLINGRIKYSGSEDANIIAIYKDGEKVDEIPAKGSGYVFDKAECTNNATAEWVNDKWGLFINMSTKTKCSLYFKKFPYLFDLVQGYDITSTEVIDKGTNSDGTTNTLAYDGTKDYNLRYVGANPANYVNYNCDNNGENCELWRIIGVFNNMYTTESDYNNKTNPQTLIKLIRAESLGEYSWDTSAEGTNIGSGINQWGESGSYEGADLMRELNTDYLGNITVGTDGKWYNGSKNTKTATKPTTTLNSTAQNMIQDVLWNTGSPSNNNGSYDSSWTNNIIPSLSYERERADTNGKVCSYSNYCNDTVTRTSTWYGKVALMYPSDYGYATSGGTTTPRSTCLNSSMYGWDGSSITNCKDGDWLLSTRFTLSPFAGASDPNLVFAVSKGGHVSKPLVIGTSDVHPVIFLKSSVSITGGTGTSTDPYTLG